MKKIKAKIKYIQLNVGFWTLEADGKKYEVLRMPPQLKQDGETTYVWIEEVPDVTTVNMYGTPVKIRGFETV